MIGITGVGKSSPYSVDVSTDYTGVHVKVLWGMYSRWLELQGSHIKVRNIFMNSNKSSKGKGKQQQIAVKPKANTGNRGNSLQQPSLNSLSPKESSFVQQIMCPELCKGGSPMLSPALVAARAQATHYKLEHVIANIADDTTVCVKPTLNPVSITTQNSQTIGVLYFEGLIDSEGFFVGEAFAGDEDTSLSEFQLVALLHTAQIKGRTGLNVQLDGGAAFNMDTIGWPPGTYRFFGYDPVALAWVDYGTFDGDSAGSGNNQVAFTMNANGAVALSIQGDGGSFVPGLVDLPTLIVNANNSMHTVVSSATHSPVSIVLPEGTERFRITSLAVKGTFFGSTLNDQGEIAIARTYPGWTPFDSDSPAWDTIASLPFQSYDGRLELGAHGWWLPTDVRELDFRNVNAELTSLDLTRLWMAVRGADPTATLRIELDIVLEFYSPSYFFSKDPVPYFSDRAGRIMHLLGNETCVGDNPGHLARIAGIGKKVAQGMKTVGEVASIFA